MIRPDIVLIFTFYLGLSCRPISGGIVSFFVGYLMDLFSGNALGLYTFSRPLLFYGAHFFRTRFFQYRSPRTAFPHFLEQYFPQGFFDMNSIPQF